MITHGNLFTAVVISCTTMDVKEKRRENKDGDGACREGIFQCHYRDRGRKCENSPRGDWSAAAAKISIL